MLKKKQKKHCNTFLLVSNTMDHFSYFDTKNYFIDLRAMTLKLVGFCGKLIQ